MTALDRLAQAHLDAIWSRLRLLAVDVETTQPDGEPPRVVAVAVQTCRRGQTTGSINDFVDPQVPIDARSQKIHGITDDMVAGEPTFEEIADKLLDYLQPDPDEQTFLVGHNVGFDISTLRAELRRVGADDLPDLPVLDTMGKLPRHLDVDLVGDSLPVVAHAVGVDLLAHHSALDDARASGQIAIRLLELAAAAGYDDIDALRDDINETRTAHRIRRAGPGKVRDAPIDADLPELPDDHLDSHLDVLSPNVRSKGLQQWTAQLVECGRHRCPYVEDRVEEAGPRPARKLQPVEAAVRTLAEAGDGPGAATLLPSLCGLLEHLPPRSTRLGVRDAMLDWVDDIAPALDALARCEPDDRCPTCAAGEPCPLDTWRLAAAPLALGDPTDRSRGFLKPNGARAGHGAYVTWTDDGRDQLLADQVLALVIDHHRRDDKADWAQTVAQFGWKAGSRHPDIAATYANILARPGRPDDLQAAIDVIDESLETRSGSTAPAWRHLVAQRAQLAGLQRRSQGRPTGEIDEDGNPILDPPHKATEPARRRRNRFVV